MEIVRPTIITVGQDYFPGNGINGASIRRRDQLHNKRAIGLYRFKGTLPNTHILRIEMKNHQTGDIIPIDLTAIHSHQLARYYREIQGEEPNFNCVRFAHFMQGYEIPYGDFDPKKWRLEPIDNINTYDWNTSEIYGFGDKPDFYQDPPQHLAVYLGHGIFAAKEYRFPSILFTDLERVMYYARSEYACRVIPLFPKTVEV